MDDPLWRRRHVWKKQFLSFQGRDGGGAPAAASSKCDDDTSSGRKLSFKCEAGSCSLTSSSVVYSQLSFASTPTGRTEQQWITTDLDRCPSLLAWRSCCGSGSRHAQGEEGDPDE